MYAGPDFLFAREALPSRTPLAGASGAGKPSAHALRRKIRYRRRWTARNSHSHSRRSVLQFFGRVWQRAQNCTEPRKGDAFARLCVFVVSDVDDALKVDLGIAGQGQAIRAAVDGQVAAPQV